MAGQHYKANTQEDTSKRQERAQRILDAAAELLQRWGYRKTTIDDIARQAGVAKGTIYLHWKTRETLFYTLLLRESLSVADEMLRNITDDPEGMTLHGLMKHSFLATMHNPLIRGIFMQDTEMLGELLRPEMRQVTIQQKIASSQMYMTLLRSKGMVREDLSDQKILSALTSITIGFMLSEPLMPDEYKLSWEETADILAETIRRTFEPETPVSPEALREVTEQFQHMYQTLLDTANAQIQEAL